MIMSCFFKNVISQTIPTSSTNVVGPQGCNIPLLDCLCDTCRIVSNLEKVVRHVKDVEDVKLRRAVYLRRKALRANKRREFFSRTADLRRKLALQAHLKGESSKVIFDKQENRHKIVSKKYPIVCSNKFSRLRLYPHPKQVDFDPEVEEPVKVRYQKYEPSDWFYILETQRMVRNNQFYFVAESLASTYRGRHSKGLYQFWYARLGNSFELAKQRAKDRMRNLSKKDLINLSNLKKNFNKDSSNTTPDECSLDLDRIVGQIGELDTGGEKPTVDVKDITTIANTGDQEQALPGIEAKDSQNWIEMSTSQQIEQQDSLEKRWYPIKSFTWTTSDANGAEKCKIQLPRDLVALIADSPVGMKIFQHSFFKADLRLKVKLSSNKFMTGSLIVGFYYCDKFDGQFDSTRKDYRYWYNLPGSHMIKADEANEVELIIPYKYFKSALSITGTNDRTLGLDMGMFKIYVLTQLKTGATNTISSVPVTIFACLENVSYYGTRSRFKYDKPTIQGQMMSALGGMMAMKIVDKLNQGDTDNRDMPHADLVNSRVLPMASVGLSSGRNAISLCENLGFEPNSETQHPMGSGTNISETSLSTIANHFGYIKTVQWSKDDAAEALIYGTRVNPVATDLPTNVVTVDNKQMLFTLPTPLASVAGCFHLIRGSMEYCFDFMNSDIHSGMLKISFIPHSEETTDAARLLGSFIDYVDIGTTKRYIKKIPFISDRPWIVRRSIEEDSTDLFESYGYLSVTVVNPLISMDSVTTIIDIVISVRGGLDMEFAVPITPMYKPFLSSYSWSATDVTAKQGYRSYNPGVWHTTKDNIIMRYGDTTDHITQFEGRWNYKKIYKAVYPSSVSEKKRYIKMYAANEGAYHEPEYFAFGYVGTDRTYLYCFPLGNDQARCYEEETAKWTEVQEFPYNCCVKATTDRMKQTCFNPHLDNVIVYFTPTSAPTSGVKGQIGELESVILDAGLKQLPSSGSGLKFFGEQFSDCKELCRRFTMYTHGQTKFPAEHLGNILDVNILPVGLKDPDMRVIECNNYNAYFSTMFRMGRGSMEHSIVVSNATATPCTIIVQHRPDVVLYNNNQPKMSPKATYKPCYAHTLVNTNVNPNIKVRTPYYNPNNCLLLGAPNFDKKDAAGLYSLGALRFFKASGQNNGEQLYYTIESALGEDFKLSLYTAMPWCLLGTEVPQLDITFGQEICRPFPLLLPKEALVAKHLAEDCLSYASDEEVVETTYTVRGQMGSTDLMVCNGQMGLWDWFMPNKSVTSEIAAEVGSTAGDSFMQKIGSGLDSVVQKLGVFMDKAKLIISNMFTNIAHAFSNRSYSSIIIAIVSIAFSLGLISWIDWSKVSNLFSKFYSQTFGRLFNNGDDDKVNGQGPEDEDPFGRTNLGFQDSDKVALTSLLISGIVATYGLKKWTDKAGKLPNIFDMLYEGFTAGMSKANQIFTFIKNHFLMFEKLIRWCFHKLNPFRSDNGLRLLAQDSELFTQFLDDCEEILHPAKLKEIEFDYQQITKLFMMAMIAQVIKRKFVNTEALDKIVDKQFQHRINLLKLCDRIIKERDNLINKGKCSHIRYEPFLMWIHGTTNIGKSYIVKTIAHELLKGIDYHYKGEVAYVVTPGKRHMDGAQNQPCWVWDDFMQVKGGELTPETLSMYFMFKSPATFAPPMADLAEKKKVFNPPLGIIASNKAYPNFESDLASPEAFFRRRDVLIQVRLRQGYNLPSKYALIQYGHSEYEEAQRILNNFEYVEFAFHKYPEEAKYAPKQNELESFEVEEIVRNAKTGVEKLKQVVKKVWLPYELFVSILKKKHGAYHEAKCRDYIRECSKVFDFASRHDLEMQSLAEIAKKYQEYLNMISATRLADEAEKTEYSLLESMAEWGVSSKPTEKAMFKSIMDASAAFAYGTPFHDEQKLFDHCTKNLEIRQKKKEAASLDMAHGQMGKKKNTQQKEVILGDPKGSVEDKEDGDDEDFDTASDMSKVSIPGTVLASTSFNARKYMKIKGVTDTKRQPYFKKGINNFCKKLCFNEESDDDDVVEETQSKGKFRDARIAFLDKLRRISKIKWCRPVIEDVNKMPIRFGFNFNDIQLYTADILSEFGEEYDERHKMCQHAVLILCEEEIEPNTLKFCKPLNNSHIPSFYLNGEQPPMTMDQEQIEHIMKYGFFYATCTDTKTKGHGSIYFQDDLGEWNMMVPNATCDGDFGIRRKCILEDCPVDKGFPDVYASIRAYIKQQTNDDVPVYGQWQITKEQEDQHEKLRKLIKTELKLLVDGVTIDKAKKKYFGENYWICEMLRNIVVTLSGIGLLYFGVTVGAPKVVNMLSKTVNWITTKPDSVGKVKQVEGELYQDQVVKTTKPRAKISAKGEMNPTLKQSYVDQIVGNTFFLRKGTAVGRCFGVRGHFFLMPKHYVVAFQTAINEECNQNILVQFPEASYTIQFNQIKLYRLKDSEFVICKMPQKMRQFSDITKRIVESKNTPNLSFSGFFVETGLDHMNMPDVVCRDLRFEYVSRSVDIDDGHGGSNSTDSVIKYKYSKPGACMSAVVSDNSSFPSIIGFHIAGTKNGDGFAELLVRETIVNFCDKFDIDQVKYNPMELSETLLVPGQMEIQPFVVGATNLGVVKPEYRVMNPGNTKLKHSVLYEQVFPSTYDFPLLAPWDSRIDGKFSPMREGCKYHGMDPLAFEEHYIACSFMDYRDMILEECKPLRRGVGIISIDDAILALPIDGYEPVNLNTSEGFPFVCMRPSYGHNKKWLIDCDYITRDVKLNPVLTTIYDANMERRKQGLGCPTVFIDCLKDQKMPREKAIVPGKTRIFSTSPVDYTIAVKQYFGDWSASFKHYREKLEHRVGMNVFSTEWDMLARKLLSYNNKVGALDYSKFGPTLMAEVSLKFVDMVNDWYSFYQQNQENIYEECLVREVLHRECVTSLHLANNFLYLVSTGNPSGHPLTVEVNCFVNCIYMRVCYMILCIEKNLPFDIMDFRRLVCLVVYGDDLICSLKPELCTKISLSDFCEVFSRYGIKATPASKQDKAAEFLPIDHPETTFLKGTFYMSEERNLYIYRLERRALQEIMNWSTKSDDEITNLIDTGRAFLEHVHAYGKKEYEQHRKFLQNFFFVHMV